MISLCVTLQSVGEPLMLVGQPTLEADFFRSNDAGSLTFRVGDQTRDVLLNQLVSWATVRPNVTRGEILLVDGSQIVLADSWTGKPTWELLSDVVNVTTHSFGRINVPRNLVRAILINAPNGIVPRWRFLDERIKPMRSSSSLLLNSGDRWDGKQIASKISAAGQHLISIQSNITKQRLESQLTELSAIVLNPSDANGRETVDLWIGTRDGSLLGAKSLVADDSELRIVLSCGVQLNSKRRNGDVAYLRSTRSPIEYLSDRNDAKYRHEPYLSVEWPYRRDRNVLARPLRVGGQIYAKGLGVTTATRLSYLVDRSQYQRFVASVAIDTAAAGRGSAIFRVYLRSGESWKLTFESPVVRGGDQPLPVTVDLEEATTHLALVTDYADRGDELDYANWLDARLE
ncbi:MAG: NPCBM/NEW2 domain-containing protein [Planctomycetota bacterium]